MDDPFLNLDKLAKLEEECTCKYCGRCVLAGPPCCYQNLYEMYNNLNSEVLWLRKIQGIKDRRINELEKQLETLHRLVVKP